MKAERRHELKENSLAKKLVEIPDNSKQYGTRIAMGVILVALIAILIRYRMNAAADRLAHAQIGLSEAHTALADLENPQLFTGQDDATVAQKRQSLYSDGMMAAQDAATNAPDKNPAMKAQALIYQGDLNFALANLPELVGAATQPSLRPAISTADLLSKAEDAYNQAIQTYPNEKQQWLAANFGLAAIAEDRAGPSNDQSEWDKAKHFYETIIESDPPASFAALASKRLNLLPQISQPVLTYVMPVAAQTPGGGMLGPALPGGILPETTMPATTAPGGLDSLITPANPAAGLQLLPPVSTPDFSLPGMPTTVPADQDAHPNTVLFPTTTPANP